MKDLLPYIERELGIFSGYTREFAEKFPKTAGDLLISGESCADPQVAAMIQSSAMLTARVKRLIDDAYPQFTESMLETLYPHYLRPIPSYTIVQVDRSAAQDKETIVKLARGTIMTAPAVRDVHCKFTSAYDVLLGPIALSKVQFVASIAAPPSQRMAAAVTAEIAIVIESSADTLGLGQLELDTLRVFVDGEPSLRATLIDTLFRRACAAFVQDGDGAHPGEQSDKHPGEPWHELERLPLSPVGFAADDALIPCTTRSHPAFCLLTEYFAYPEKFNFIDIDLRAITARLPARSKRCTLHLALSNLDGDSDAARLLASLSNKHLLLGCTPVLNLFKKPGVPVQLSHTTADYPVLADATHAFAYEVHTIDAARLVRESPGRSVVTEFSPLYARHFGDRAGGKGNYWLARRNDALAAVSPGHELRIALIDTEFKTSKTETLTLSTDLHCTNRDLPNFLGYGQPDADFSCDGVPADVRIRVLRKPSASYRFGSAAGAHWRLIGHLTLNYAALTNAGLDEFRKMLSLYDLAGSASSQRLIRGIVGLEHGAVRAWLRTMPRSALMPGIRIRMTVDEQAFAGSSLYLFAQAMDQYFAIGRQLNCFTQLDIVSLQTGEELITCPPHSTEPLRPSSTNCSTIPSASSSSRR